MDSGEEAKVEAGEAGAEETDAVPAVAEGVDEAAETSTAA